MFKDLRQFKAYLGSIDNFDQMYYIQQARPGINQQQIVNRLQSAIKPEMDDVFEIIWKNDKLRESVFGNVVKDNKIVFSQNKTIFTNSINTKSSSIFNSILLTK